MRILNQVETATVAGGSFGDFVEAVVSTVCSGLTRGIAKSTACAVGAAAAGNAVDSITESGTADMGNPVNFANVYGA